MWAGYSWNNQEVLVQFSLTYSLTIIQHYPVYITAGHNILKYPDTLSNMPKEIMKSMFMHHFYQYSSSVLGINRNIPIPIPIHIHIQGIWQWSWKMASNLKMACLFQIVKFTLYFHMTEGLKAIFRNSTRGWSCKKKRVAILKIFECFHTTYHIKSPF